MRKTMLKLLKQPMSQDRRQSETALLVARGTRRLLRRLNFSTLTELPLLSGRRADIVALGSNGSIYIIEIKSSAADYRSDTKWREYRAHCDRFFFAIPESMKAGLMPADAGPILADAYSADIVRQGAEHPMPPATRRAMLLRYAHAAALRLQRMTDPEVAANGG